MNFFEAQDKARKASRWLVIIYLLATALLVAGATLVVVFALDVTTTTTAGPVIADKTPLVIATALITLSVIVVATLIRTATLSSGGAKVAMSMGGIAVDPDTRDPLRRRLRNVVEEMAIASGVPVPDIFVLEDEQGINAFAAGFSPGDAAVAVTRGTLETLNRDELQGVIAHEFSHILNGDMRLNIRMIGVLYGIMVIALLGRMLLHSGRYGALTGRRDRNGSAILFIGIGLMILGWIGVFFARIIKAAISRQRENLADASAVQFTRQTRGIAGALKKIGGYTPASLITSSDPEEVSHMLFGDGMKLSSLFATHPPLDQRIRALEPDFDPGDYIPVNDRTREQVLREAESQVAAFDGGVAATATPLVDTVGNPGAEHIAAAGGLRRNLPAPLYDAAHSADDAYLLTIALLLDTRHGDYPQQKALLHERLGEQRARRVDALAQQLSAASRALRLPLLEIAFPALKRRPAAQLDYLGELLHRLVTLDGQTTLYELCFYRVVRANLAQAMAPLAKPPAASRQALRHAVLKLLEASALAGNDDIDSARRAFDKGRNRLPAWAGNYRLDDGSELDTEGLDQAIELLGRLKPRGRRQLVQAVTDVMQQDGVIRPQELELLHAICASLHVPLPLMTDGQNAVAG